MADLVPQILFDLIGAEVPADLRPNLLVVGSLAAAYHHRHDLRRDGINTKDADLVIQPAGAIAECRAIAQRLLDGGWRRHPKCHPTPQPRPAADLRAIRLYPPTSDAYFVELLAFPEREQAELKAWIPVELEDGWYGLPSFRYLGLTAHGVLYAESGLAYAAPAMMALANLLSHPTVGAERMSEPIGGRALLRSAKDLGRVLAMAWLAGRDEAERWAASWDAALRASFPSEHPALRRRAGDGLRELLDDPSALDEARHAVDVGLLAGHRITADQLRAVGQQLLQDALAHLHKRW